MTRQIFILILSSILVIFGGIWETKHLERSCNFVLSDIEYTKNLLNNNNFEGSKAQMKELDNTWKNVKDVWNIFIPHDEIDDIENSIAMLHSYVDLENKEEALVYINKLNSDLKDVIEKQQINMENIF